MQSLPLYDVFTLLRRRGFSLGIDEYQAVIHGLCLGIGTGSRDELIAMCRLIWGKSEEEQKEISTLLDTFLPKPFEDVDLWDELNNPPDVSKDNEISDLFPQLNDQVGLDFEEDVTRDETDIIPFIETNYYEGSVLGNLDLSSNEQIMWTFDWNFNFEGSLPINRRQIRQAWRYFRRMVRSGPRIEIDVDATIEQMHRTRVLSELVLVPRRLNQAQLLILVDADSCMIPFRHITRTIVELAQHSFPNHCSVAYFQRTPSTMLFANDHFSIEQNSVRLLARLNNNAGILIISDAGAAIGRSDDERVTKTVGFLQTALQYTPNIAWLNPMPLDRWGGTPAMLIGKHISMFPFERSGLERAVHVLRGKN